MAAEADRSHGAIADLIGRLVSHEETDGAERRRLLGRLSDALAENARHLRSLRERGRWLTDLFLEVARRLPVRDRETLILHHGGLTGERLADSLVRTAANATAVVGAVGGALAAVELAAPPLLLSAPAQLVAETLVVAAIEVKLIAELHEVYGQPVPGNGGRRAAAYALAWAKRRGVDPLNPGWTSAALNGAARDALRRRLTRLLGRHLTTLGPFLTGAVAGGTLNRAATKQLAAAVRADLRAIARRPRHRRCRAAPGAGSGSCGPCPHRRRPGRPPTPRSRPRPQRGDPPRPRTSDMTRRISDTVMGSPQLGGPSRPGIGARPRISRPPRPPTDEQAAGHFMKPARGAGKNLLQGQPIAGRGVPCPAPAARPEPRVDTESSRQSCRKDLFRAD